MSDATTMLLCVLVIAPALAGVAILLLNALRDAPMIVAVAVPYLTVVGLAFLIGQVLT